MKKTVKLLAYMALLPLPIFAQNSIKGKIVEKENQQALTGANIVLENSYKATFSGLEGNFQFDNLKDGTYQLKVSYVGFDVVSKEVILPSTEEFVIEMTKSEVWTDEVIISGTRASERTATTYKELKKEEIERINVGQDIPMLLSQTPSVVSNSDAGAGVGYTGMTIRGSDITRINVTVNGVPVNDSESHGVFWVNMPDFVSSVNSIQVQRGAGTSTNGTGAFGASVNIQTNTLRRDAYVESFNSVGSFNTFKNNLMVGTGLIKDKFTLDARLSQIGSDGFIDRASSDLKSYYISGGYYGKKSVFRLNVFSGKERTYQAWYGIPEAKYRGDINGLTEHYYNNVGSLYHTPQDSTNLFNPNNNRTYNFYQYPNQTDNYQQDHYQGIYNTQISDKLNLNIVFHYTYGRGFYEEFRYRQRFSSYGLPNFTLGGTTISRTNLIRRRWLDNHFYGTVYNITYNPTNNLSLIVGGAANQYKGKHFGEVIWSQYSVTNDNLFRYYDNDAVKNDVNAFVKGFYQVTDKLNLFADMQVRNVMYSFLGFDRNLNNVTQTANLTFFNPKGGVTYQLNKNNQLYASYSVANREPVRRDFTDSSPESRPLPENMQNIEAGYKKQSNNYFIGANLFLMEYKNQLVNTGQINDVGAYTRTNVASSFRRGIELEGGFTIGKNISWAGNFTYSMNKIKEYNDFVDNYDTFEQEITTFKNTDIALSPSVIAGGVWSFKVYNWLSFDILSKYVGDQFLDNTMNSFRKLDAFFVNDLRLVYSIKPKFMNEIVLNATIFNILDQKYAPNGYTYSFIAGGSTITENYLYPQAGRNFLVSLGIKF
jgi:iron complex outermembrane recepter protein